MKVYVVAGEPSGDLLASGLMRALIRAAGDVEFRRAIVEMIQNNKHKIQ